jgi:hypothetical protein
MSMNCKKSSIKDVKNVKQMLSLILFTDTPIQLNASKQPFTDTNTDGYRTKTAFLLTDVIFDVCLSNLYLNYNVGGPKYIAYRR